MEVESQSVHLSSLSWWQKIPLKIIASGPKVEHLAIVMDGNRRFAEKHAKDPVFGHMKGSRTFFRILEMVRFIGITELTVYAFSVENFKRPQEELSSFMELMLEVLREMLDNAKEYNAKGIRIGFIGELSMFSEEHQNVAKCIVKATEANRNFSFNLAIGYTSRFEITRSIRMVLDEVQRNQMAIEDVNEVAVEKFLYTHGGKPVDLLVRTSGESRLSDFLMWQNDSAVLHFSKVLWPDFGVLNFIGAMLHYQKAVRCRQRR